MKISITFLTLALFGKICNPIVMQKFRYIFQYFPGLVNSGYLSDDHGTGYGALSSIAQGSAADAHNAVSSQHYAAQKASYVAKTTLALQAAQAAATAQAALAGKHVLLQFLEKLRDEAHKALEAELAQLQSAKHTAAATAQTAQQAAKQVAILHEALRSAEELAHQADAAAGHAAEELASQSKMVAQAKARLAELEHKLEATRADFVATKAAAQKAAAFAQKAKANAAAAGHGGGDSSGHGGSFGY